MTDPVLMLPITPDNIHSELESVEAVVRKWREFVGQGIPGIDIPTSDAELKLDTFLRQFTGELLFVSGKLNNIAMVLSER